MFSKHLSAMGTYPSSRQAQVGVGVLMENGFDSAGIFVLPPKHRSGAKAPLHPGGAVPQGPDMLTAALTGLSGLAGSALCGALAIHWGGTLAHPAMPFAAVLSGLVLGGAAGRWIAGRLGAATADEAFIGYFSDGPTLLMVTCDSNEELSQAKAVLARSGAQSVSETSEISIASLAA